MYTKYILRALFVGLTFGTVLYTSCSPAAYEIVKGKKKKNVDDSGRPETIQSDEDAPNGTDRTGNENPNKNPFEDSLPPTARVEVIWQGKSVTQVFVNEAVSIQPSVDTLDPDDIGISSCRNPGIVSADYDLDGGVVKDQERGESCQPLAVGHTFTRTGEYLIQMVVTSNENETATAGMILKVVDQESPRDRGFTITAKPLLVAVDTPVAFQGICVTPTSHRIDWDFGDETQASGDRPTHPYQASGQYTVQGTCTDENNHKMRAWLTIVVVDGDQSIPTIPGNPGEPNGPTPPTDPNNPQKPSQPIPDPGKPGQKPGQQKPGQQKPGQQKPGQS